MNFGFFVGLDFIVGLIGFIFAIILILFLLTTGWGLVVLALIGVFFFVKWLTRT